MTPDVKAEDLWIAGPGDFVMVQPETDPPSITVYRCDAGHELKMNGNCTFHALAVSDDAAVYLFDYCPRCFGEWAVKQWPLRKVEP